ncbi:fatty acyl-AMP ligase [Pyxidicoccus fallax]|uniref:Fatty acyl-AMP ligase n=1 Tax=Pyxidicoccus fallax TaxID=394095 RepID=A0A848LHH9_9BACT|nr:fatty acyl-AMP ligase [Pyxidicoccus fallax]NMO17325.1 fatty acyl-AMP ligase [Pyxidicoccus fallax]NPC78956.1 fatty acyl-AMP ligase [Pyxidicoccus fallax]
MTTPRAENFSVPLQRGDTLVEMLRQSALAHPEAGIRLLSGGEEVEWLPLEQLYLDAGRLATGLLNEAGVRPGDRVALLLPTSGESIRGLFGVLAAGAVPVPLPPPMPFSNPERYLERTRGAMARSDIRLLLGPSSHEGFLEMLRGDMGDGVRTRTLEPLMESTPTWQSVSTDAPALIQYTSGSTTAPKGAVLTHRNLLSNVEAIRRGLRMTSKDVGCVWLPLFHDMGLIGCLLASVYVGIHLVMTSPENFVLDPEGWLELFGRYKGTIAPAPNAGYLHCVKKVGAEAVKRLDLSSWRLALMGAEAVDPVTVRRFCEHFAPAGFRPESVMPVYGLAEASLAVTFSELDTPLRTLSVARTELGQGVVEPMQPGHPDAREVVSVGTPVHDTQVRVLDARGEDAEAGRVGEIHVRGGSVMQGYDRNPDASGAAFRDGWLATGDLGFLHEGRLYVVGRQKEVIIFNGNNYYATDVEAVARQVPGVREALAVGVQLEGTEGLVVLVETRERDEAPRKKLVATVRETVSSTLGISPKDVVLVERGRIPRTSSGKLERHKARTLYEEWLAEQGTR